MVNIFLISCDIEPMLYDIKPMLYDIQCELSVETTLFTRILGKLYELHEFLLGNEPKIMVFLYKVENSGSMTILAEAQSVGQYFDL
jgi:hypothetical protein